MHRLVGFLSALAPLILGDTASLRQSGMLRTLASVIYFCGLLAFGGLYIGSLAKWRVNDRAIRRFIAEYNDTPKCFGCEYNLTGSPRSPDSELRCPKCTQNWPWHNRIPDPRPHMFAIGSAQPTDDSPAPPPSDPESR